MRREGSALAVGLLLGGHSGVRAIERAKKAIRDGRRPGPLMVERLRLLVVADGDPADIREARLALMEQRYAAGLGLFDGAPVRHACGRPLLEVAQELGLVDQDLLDRARFIDAQNARRLERLGVDEDQDDDQDEPGADGRPMVVLLEGGAA